MGNDTMSDEGRASRLDGICGLVPAAELAKVMGFAGVTDSFRTLCAKLGIQPVRPGWYDPYHVRHRLNVTQGMFPPVGAKGEGATMSLVEQRRARNGAL